MRSGSGAPRQTGAAGIRVDRQRSNRASGDAITRRSDRAAATTCTVLGRCHATLGRAGPRLCGDNGPHGRVLGRQLRGSARRRNVAACRRRLRELVEQCVDAGRGVPVRVDHDRRGHIIPEREAPCSVRTHRQQKHQHAKFFESSTPLAQCRGCVRPRHLLSGRDPEQVANSFSDLLGRITLLHDRQCRTLITELVEQPADCTLQSMDLADSKATPGG